MRCCIRLYPSGVLCSVLGEAHFDMHAHIKDASTNRSYVHVNCESNDFSLHVDAHRAFGARIRACRSAYVLNCSMYIVLELCTLHNNTTRHCQEISKDVKFL